jgi:hypothetical protein
MNYETSMAERTLRHSPYLSLVPLVPPGRAGNVEIQHFGLNHMDVLMGNLRAIRNGNHEQVCSPGNYVGLYIDGQTVMSDTAMEHRTNLELWAKARGKCLIVGLGLGLVLHGLVKKIQAQDITVVEINPGVIQLVEPTIPRGITVIQSSAAEFVKGAWGRQWDTIYLDIWPTISLDDRAEVRALKRAYRRLLAPGGWIGAWADDLRRREARR